MRKQNEVRLGRFNDLLESNAETVGRVGFEQIVFDTIAMVIMGVIVAALNRDPLPARA